MISKMLKHLEEIERGPAVRLYREFGKRVFDITLILFSLPFALPIIGILALLVALSGGKPFYSQDRVGKNGRIYRMWKLRSMVKDADACLERHLRDNPDLRREWDRSQKLVNDPRITWFGRFLRKSSVDELPQLFNVLTGDMSLVGPRPMLVSQKSIYPGEDYYDLRPGITGLWQICDRHHTTFAERANYDARYNRILSFPGDLMILAATVKVVMRNTGC